LTSSDKIFIRSARCAGGDGVLLIRSISANSASSIWSRNSSDISGSVPALNSLGPEIVSPAQGQTMSFSPAPMPVIFGLQDRPIRVEALLDIPGRGARALCLWKAASCLHSGLQLAVGRR
jgi:hypothetical protein